MIRAFRPINLFIIGLVCLAFQIISSRINGSAIQLSTPLVIYTSAAIIVGAAGYLINGYYDREIDVINHSGYKFPLSKSRTYAVSLFLIVLALSLGLAFFSIKFTIGFILFPALALWLYSAALKKTPVIGNLLIAFISFWLPTGLMLYNGSLGKINSKDHFAEMGMLVLVEVFLVSFAREVIKDIQDIKGDKISDCKTLPVLFGEKVAGIVATTILMIGSLIWFNVVKKHFDSLTIISILFSVITFLVLIISIFMLWSNKTWKERTTHSSLLIKIGMLTALLTLIFI